MNAPQLSHINPEDSKYLITQTGRSPSATWAAGEKNHPQSEFRSPRWCSGFFFRNMATLDSFVNQLRQIRKQKNLSLMCMDLPIWGAESRNSCLFPHSKRSQRKFFTVLFFLWSETSRQNGFLTWWHDSFRADPFERKPLDQCNSVIRFWLWAFSIVSTRWPVTPKCIFLRNQWPLVFGGPASAGFKHLRFYVSIIS